MIPGRGSAQMEVKVQSQLPISSTAFQEVLRPQNYSIHVCTRSQRLLSFWNNKGTSTSQ